MTADAGPSTDGATAAAGRHEGDAGSTPWRPVRGGAHGLVEQLVDELSRRIEQQALRAGSRLPSVRQMAQQAGVSRFTVVEAYERLAARGLVQPRHGAGFFVKARRVRLGGAQPTPERLTSPEQVDIAWLLRSMFRDDATPGTSGATGLLPAAWLDPDLVAGAVRAVGRSAGESFLGYGHPQGYPALREQLAQVLLAEGIAADPEQNLLITSGVTHGLDLLLRLLVEPGDTVLVEDPAWYLIFGRLAAFGVRVLGVPRGPEGPDIAKLEQLAAQHRPKLFLVNSVVHNPTGHTLSAAAAYDVLRIAERHDFLVVEDETYADLHPGGAIRLATLDRLNRVVLVGGYAKTLAASLRVGYLAARPELVRRLTDLKLLTGLTTVELSERVLHKLLQDGHYLRHVARVRQRVDEARQRCIKGLQRLGLRIPHLPYAGIFVWADCGRDAETVSRIAAEQGLLLAPGSLFSPSQSPSTMLRFTVSMIERRDAWPLLQRVLAAA
ncbi:PLP-dependent aminotransferase family protein [Frateuria defendens]|uniref:aminotransferase-like domain-containing protein n=1 Tax=Frateuria defendens TaxID=2219559 RepID=UPI0009E31B61|nr:PLP-dependent aminotransferase family protein [Frateuria defendens]